MLVPALVLMLAFAFFYVGAFHDPTPHHVPLAVVGPPAVAAQLNRLPGDPLDARQASSRSDALSQIDDREVYGAYEPATNRLFVASAANRATAVALEADVQPRRRGAGPAGRPRHRRQAAAVRGPQRHRGVLRGDRVGVRRLHRRDADRVDREPTQHQQAARCSAGSERSRGFRIVAGILSVVMLRASFGRVLGPRGRAVLRSRALTIFASGAATAGIQAAAGPAGTGLVILVFVILGNSASGGPFARPLLPGLWRTIGGVLPPGASVDLARSALFFDGARDRGPDSRARGLGGPRHRARARAGRPHHEPGRRRGQRQPREQRCKSTSAATAERCPFQGENMSTINAHVETRKELS